MLVKPRVKRWCLWLGLSVLVAFVALNLLAYNHAYAMMHFTQAGTRTAKPEKLGFWAKLKVLMVGVNLPRPSNHRLPSELAPDCQALVIPGPESFTLGAWSCERGPETPLVLMFHGYATEKTALLPEARALLDLGASVLLVDFRGSGDSSGDSTTIGMDEADDVAAVLHYAEGHFVHSRIYLFGQSMGAAAVLRAVQVHALRPQGVIVEAVFDTMRQTVGNRFRAMGLPAFPGAELLVFWGGWQAGFNGFRHNPVDYAKDLTCPALFLHGSADPRAKLAEGRRVYDAAPGPKSFITFEQTGHESYVTSQPAEWRAAIGDFLRGGRP